MINEANVQMQIHLKDKSKTLLLCLHGKCFVTKPHRPMPSHFSPNPDHYIQMIYLFIL